MKKEIINEIVGVIVLACGLILLASLISFVPEDLPWYTSTPNAPSSNLIKAVGAFAAGSLFFVFGYSAYFLVVFLFFWSWNKFSSRDLQFTLSKFFSFMILFCVVSALLSMIGPQSAVMRFNRAGVVGFVCAEFLVNNIGSTGAYIILCALGVLTLIITGEFMVSPLLFRLTSLLQEFATSLQERWEAYLNKREERKEKVAKLKYKVKPAFSFPSKPFTFQHKKDEDAAGEEEGAIEGEGSEKNKTHKRPNIRITESKNQGGEVKGEPKIIGEYFLPTLDLLTMPPSISTSKIQSSLESGARTLETTLENFNVNARVADIERGPVITRYELEPAPGVKIQKITTLADDIALAMKAAAVRIVAPIPGKNRVGIEVPNSSTAAVYLKDVLACSRYQSAESKLTLAIGKDIAGKAILANLAEMPHLLIAGTTGSGKTVCVNTLIMSILFNASPEEVKFLLIDPKMVELTQYNDIPHMLCPTVTDSKKVSAALHWLVSEMENRYQVLSKEGVRNIQAYHKRGHKLPYIIIVIDELADLMQTAAKTVESAITRLAQLSRAVGIHLILATQRPSVNVITGVIKANFPARISFKVASKVDSRTVLDMNGAETLLGKGDLLFIKPGDAKPTRGQCSFVSDEEVQNVINNIKGQQQPVYNEEILKKQKNGASGGLEEKDELYDEALKLVIETNQASVSILQRRMRLGYTRAARLIDMMEQDGVVGPYCGSKPREILVDREGWLMENMSTQDSE